MKKILTLFILLSLVFPVSYTVHAAYTLDTIYGSYDTEEEPHPYLKPSIGFEPFDVEEIQLGASSIYFHYNEAEEPVSLDARRMPINSKREKITYKSSDETVAVVDENGMVSSKNKLGSAIITASCGKVFAECRVNVIIGVADIKIEQAPKNLYADKPAAAQLEAHIFPENAGRKDVIWKTSDASIATVDRTGTVMPCGVGSVTITAVTKDRGLSDSCTINVGVWENPVKAIFIENQIEAIPVGASYQLNSYIYPEGAMHENLVWSSSDRKTISVNEKGVITAHKTGSAKITLTAGEFSDSFYLKAVNADMSTFSYNVTSKPITERVSDLRAEVTYSSYDYTLDEATDIQERSAPTVFLDDAYPATREEIEFYIDPAELTDGAEKYQFLNLSQSNGISADAINAYLNGKGVLSGMGDVFVAAAKEYNLSEVYLAVHACLESGNGSSQLATGVTYNGETVYNMFGIGAVDSAPLAGGAEYAYINDWTDVESAIIGGARWISENYINNPNYRQNTLYKMRWNPQQPGVHQYATDVAWASKQAQILRNMFAAFPSAKTSYEYPVYRGEDKLTIPID